MYVFLGVTEDVVVVGALGPEEALEEGEWLFAALPWFVGVWSGLFYLIL